MTSSKEQARLYAEWRRANERAAAVLRTRTPGQGLGAAERAKLEDAEAEATNIVRRYRASSLNEANGQAR